MVRARHGRGAGRGGQPVTGVSGAFAGAAGEGRAVGVGYLPAGFPTVDGAIEAARAMAESGADVIEIGLPYTDPLLDGPVVQAAVDRALAGGTRVTDVPVLVMTYWNPVDHYGVHRFARDLAAAGGSGLITPDLTPEEAGPWLDAAAAHGLDRVFLVAPSSTPERVELITKVCAGFVYAVSIMGITGARDQVSDAAAGVVSRIRACTDLPVAVGLGVRDGAQAAQVAGFADGVIVGSAFVQRLLDAPDLAAGIRGVRDLAGDLAAGVRRPVRAGH